MYASWLDYNVITNRGAKKEALKFTIPQWSNVGLGYVNRGDVGSFSTPASGVNVKAMSSIGDVPAPWARSFGQYGARPALYC